MKILTSIWNDIKNIWTFLSTFNFITSLISLIVFIVLYYLYTKTGIFALAIISYIFLVYIVIIGLSYTVIGFINWIKDLKNNLNS